MSLLIWGAYRSLETQRTDWKKSLKITEKKYPEIKDLEKVQEMTARFIAPPERAMHCTGGAVDVLLYDLKKDTALDDFDASDEDYYNELAYTANPKISNRERNNRSVLKKAMEAEDFVNYPLEWWHYSYGNAEWAIYKSNKFAVYGQL